MQLSDIRLIEVSALNIQFSHRVNESKQGKVRVDYGQLEFTAGGVLNDEQSTPIIDVKATPTITGYRDNVEGDDFQLKISLRMLYAYPSGNTIDEEFLKNNTWYFSSFLRTYFKSYADDILKKTAISGIELVHN